MRVAENALDPHVQETPSRTGGDHRIRIYSSYLSGRRDDAVPEHVNELRRHSAYYRHLIKHYLPRDRQVDILELGCGQGVFLHFLQQEGYERIEGIDVSSEQIAVAKRLGLNCVREAEILQTLRSCPRESYDVILMFDVLEHFKPDELFGIADAVRRALRKGGTLICRVPNGGAPFASRMRYGDLTHQLLFTNESLVQLLSGAGFARIECFDDAPVMHDLKSLIRAGLWHVMSAWLRLWLSVETGGFARKALFGQNFLSIATK